jgi:hypothetical protein
MSNPTPRPLGYHGLCLGGHLPQRDGVTTDPDAGAIGVPECLRGRAGPLVLAPVATHERWHDRPRAPASFAPIPA